MRKRGKRGKSGFLLSGGMILLAYAVILLAAPAIAPYEPNDQDLYNVLGPPSSEHLLGTDSLGRDVLSRIIYGSRYSLIIALGSISLTAIIGVSAGLTAGYFGGKVDDVIMRVTDIFLAFPALIAAILIVSLLGPGVRSLIIAITISYSPRLIRIGRAAALEVREMEFMVAARAIGASNRRIMISYVLPNAFAPILVEVSLRAGQAVLTTAALGFLGLGISPPAPEWGAMISRGRAYLAIAPHIVMGPGAAISFAILGFNLFGDGLRDTIDPKLRRLR